MDGLAIVTLLFIGSLSVQLPDWAENLRWIGLILFVGASVGIFVFAAMGHKLMKYIPEGKLRYAAEQLLDGVRQSASNPAKFLLIILLSGAVWSVEGLMFYYGYTIFDLPAPGISALFVLGVVNLAVLVPAAPGGVGLFHGAAAQSLTVFGISESVGFAYGTVIHACQILPIIVVGMLLLKIMGNKSLFALHREVQESDR